VRNWRQTRRRQAEQGIALLIAIFILLLISVVAVALIVASGTETALAGNYRSSTGVYYAALAGLEEARERLLSKNSNSFSNTAPGFLPAPGNTLQIGWTYYVLNPGPGETAANILTTYQDNEYATEFGAPPDITKRTTTLSVWNAPPLSALPVPGPLYKWVRINAVSEQSLNLSVAPSYSPPPYDSTSPVFYDSTIGTGQLNIAPTGFQVLEITALAQLPNGSQKLLQYLVAPTPITLPPFPAALTLAAGTGNNVAFSAPTSNGSYYVSGNDIAVPELPSCTTGNPVDAIAVYHTLAVGAVINGGNGGTGIPSAFQHLYTGLNAAPDVQRDPLTNFQMPSQVNGLAQSIIQNADVVIPGPATGSNLPTTMSSTNLMTIAVTGNLDLTSWHNTGYGLLLVTGNLNYDPDASWDGIVLVIGKGTVTGSRAGSGVFNGAFFVANTLDSSGNLLPDPNLGFASVIFASNMGSVGIRYSSCWIKAAQPSAGYKILSFHEISQ